MKTIQEKARLTFTQLKKWMVRTLIYSYCKMLDLPFLDLIASSLHQMSEISVDFANVPHI